MYVAYVAFSPLKHVTYLKYEITPRDLYYPQDNIYIKKTTTFWPMKKTKYNRKINP